MEVLFQGQIRMNIGTVSADSPVTVTFQVIVTTTPPSNPLQTLHLFNTLFLVDPTAPPVTGTIIVLQHKLITLLLQLF